MGLDVPPLQGIVHDLKAYSKGDFGISLLSKQNIRPLIFNRLFHSFLLAVTSLSFAIILSLFLGILAAAHPDGGWDRLCETFSAITSALPLTWLGPVLMIFFALKLKVVSVDHNIFLPTLTLGLGLSAFWSRMIRDRVRETLSRGAAPGARARGIPEWRVLLKYGFAPTAGPLLAFLGTQLGVLVSGAAVVEVIFTWPGLGALLIEAVLRRDYPIVEAVTFIAATLCVLGTILGDAAHHAFDPRRKVR